jgi:hypothetical protein
MGPEIRLDAVEKSIFFWREPNPDFPARRYTEWALKLYNVACFIDGRLGPCVWSRTWDIIVSSWNFCVADGVPTGQMLY